MMIQIRPVCFERLGKWGKTDFWLAIRDTLYICLLSSTYVWNFFEWILIELNESFQVRLPLNRQT